MLMLPATLSANTLWDRAVDLYRETEGLVPGRMAVSFIQYNGRGQLVGTETSELELRINGDGEVEAYVISAESDGEDVTQERRENPQSAGGPFGGAPDGDDEPGGGPFAGIQISPLDPDEQDRVRLTRVGPITLLDGIQVREIDFIHQTDEKRANTGTAWIAVETGEPVALEITIEPLPMLVHEFRMRQEYGRDADGRLVMQRMEFVGEGTLLLIRRRIESELIFSQYFPSP
jgi:hypothetical protein